MGVAEGNLRLEIAEVAVEDWCSRGEGMMKIMPVARVAPRVKDESRATMPREARRCGDNRGTRKRYWLFS